MRSRSNIRYECTKSSKRWLNVTLCESSDQLSRNRKWGVRGGGLWTIVLWTLPHAPWMFLTSLTVSRWCLDILVSGCQSNDHEGGCCQMLVTCALRTELQYTWTAWQLDAGLCKLLLIAWHWRTAFYIAELHMYTRITTFADCVTMLMRLFNVFNSFWVVFNFIQMMSTLSPLHYNFQPSELV